MVRFKKFLKWFENDLEETILIALLIALSVVMMLQVIMRYVFLHALSWPEEFCRYCFVYSGFIALGYCVRKGKALKVEVIVKALPPIVGKVIEFLGEILSLGLYGYFFYYSFDAFKIAAKTATVSTALSIPMEFIYLSVIIGFGLACIRQIEMMTIMVVKMFRHKNGKEVDAV